MSIPKSDLLGVTMAVILVAGQQFLAVKNFLVKCCFPPAPRSLGVGREQG